MPWAVLTGFVFLWGIPDITKWLDGISVFKFPLEGLLNLVEKVPPVVAKPHKEAAVYALNWLSPPPAPASSSRPSCPDCS